MHCISSLCVGLVLTELLDGVRSELQKSLLLTPYKEGVSLGKPRVSGALEAF
jgi:hypothetical protein